MAKRGKAIGWAALAAAGAIAAASVALCPRRPPPPSSHQELPPPRASEAFPNAWPDPPPADVAALLGGLAPGAVLAEGWRVRGVSPVIDGHVVVDVEKGELGFRVVLMPRDKDRRAPPAASERYALYTVQPRPSAEKIRDDDYAPVLTALRARLLANEARVAVPRGM
jgi:hypothetical protein